MWGKMGYIHSGFLPPHKNTPAGEQAILNCPKSYMNVLMGVMHKAGLMPQSHFALSVPSDLDKNKELTVER